MKSQVGEFRKLRWEIKQTMFYAPLPYQRGWGIPPSRDRKTTLAAKKKKKKTKGNNDPVKSIQQKKNR